MPSAIESEGLTRRFGAHIAIDSVSLQVPEGSVYGFLGRNGAGKTTLIKLVLGLLRPDGGQVRVRGIDVARDRLVVDPGIGFAKNTEQNVALLAATARLAQLGPLLVGASKKRFIGELCREPVAGGRLGGSVGAAVWCALRGAAVVRVHDVKATRQALAVAELLADKESLNKAYV